MTHQAKPYPEHLLNFFLYHLNRIYYGKSHLLSKLPELQSSNRFRNLNLAMQEMSGDIERQLARIELMHELLNQTLQPELAKDITGIVDCAFNKIAIKDATKISDLSLIYYLQVVESIEMSCFKLMRMTAVKIGNKQVKQLLKENYDDAKANRLLLLMLATECLFA